MGKRPGTRAFVNWKARSPFVKQWSLMSDGSRAQVLDFWIRAPEFDEWTFGQLQELLGSLLEVDDIPPALERWSLEYSARRRKVPVRRGRKGHPSEDFLMAFEAMLRHHVDGEPKRAIYEDMSGRTMPPARSARRRYVAQSSGACACHQACAYFTRIVRADSPHIAAQTPPLQDERWRTCSTSRSSISPTTRRSRRSRPTRRWRTGEAKAEAGIHQDRKPRCVFGKGTQRMAGGAHR